MTGGFECSRCGQHHDGLPMSVGAEAPYWYYGLSPEECDRRAELSSDQCVIDGEQFFVRGVLEIPVVDGDGPFTWGVWVSLSQASYLRMGERWYARGRERDPSYFGWLSTELPLYPSTLNLKTRVHTRPVGMRPTIELEPTDHPLAVEQREGITRARAEAIAHELLHHEQG
jgi:hypothetical protein